MKLNDIAIRALPKPAKGAVIYADDMLVGFGVRVSEGGTKSYVLTHGRRRTRETIGRVGIVSLQDARKAAKELLAGYTLGRHKPRSTSWNLAVEGFLKEKAGKRPNTLSAYKRHLTYFPFGETPLPEVTAPELQRDLAKIKKAGERQKTFVVLRVFLNWCFQKHYIETNPIARMKGDSSTPRERVLTDEELRAVWRACEDDNFGRIVKLLILTGQRRSEIANLADGMIKDDLITFPACLTKNKRDHTFPMPTAARSFINSTAKMSDFIFPSRALKTSFNGWSKSKVALDKRCGVKDWTLHDLRRTLRTRWAELGISSEIAETYINHISGTRGGIARVYNLAKYLPAMRDAVKVWEAHLQTVLEL